MIITIIITLVRLSEKLLRLFGRGATSFPGKLALFLKKDILKSLSRGVRIIAVTGTNGKTTTCAMIESALKKAGVSCFLNRSGANLITGVTAAFIANCNLFGRCRYDCAVLECDENALKKISLYIDAQILVVTNIFRDQLDRYGEVSSTLAAIKEGAGNMKNALLVLNADDPLTFSLSRLGNPYVSFGISKRLSLGGRGESEFCPFCGTAYEYAFRTYSQLGGFYCPSCGYARETPDYSAEEVFLQDPDTSSFFAVFRGKAALVSVNLGGIYNVYNALAAAHNAVANQHSKDCTNNPRRNCGIVEAVNRKGRLQVIGSQHIKAACVCKNEENRENYCDTAVFQRSLNVVSRAAVAVAVGIFALVNLGQGALDKCRSTANDSDNPHPENRAVATKANSGGNTNNVAGAHTGCRRNHQSLERRDRTFFCRLFSNNFNRFFEHTQLDKFRTESEVNTSRKQNDDQNRIIKNTVESANNRHHKTTHSFFEFCVSTLCSVPAANCFVRLCKPGQPNR